jgi:hypothetical protein
MGRRRTAAQIQRQATLTLARENFYKNKPASTLTTVRKREIEAVIYGSYSIKTTTTSDLYKLQASKAAVLFFGGLTALGLRDPAAVTDPVSGKPRNFKPAQVHAMVATATPTASVSPWGTRVIKYSAATTGTAQAHYSSPITASTPLVTYDNVDARASAIFNAIKGTLGDLDYARFFMTAEEFSNIKN